MVDQIKTLMKRNGLIISIGLILFIIVTNSIFMIFSRKGTIESLKIKEQVFAANQSIELIIKHVNLLGMGLRGYIIDQDEKFLIPYHTALASYKENHNALRAILIEQGFDISKFDPAEQAIEQYIKLVEQMVHMCVIGSVDEAIRNLKNDPGYDAVQVFNVFYDESIIFENQLSEQADNTYKAMVLRMAIAQSSLMLIGIPILILAILGLRRGKKTRISLFKNLSMSNKKYIFDSGNDIEDGNDELVIQELIENLEKATHFINNITDGNNDVTWEGISKENASLNKDNIAGELILMRDQMKKVKSEDEIRIWITQGLSNFAEIVRSNQHDFKLLAEKLINNLVKYLNAQQGGLFIVNTENEDDAHLELMGCYAYDRLKSLKKRVEFGQGLVGQSYLEKESIYMTEVPQEFVNITSGLGDTRPDCILIVPLKLNDKIEGVIELASMKPFNSHEIEFVEKLGESIASAITTVRTAENTKVLLEQSQQQAEEMRAQEEEMRQNMEELQATQEQIHRKNEEVENLLKKASENEESMKLQMDELEELRDEADQNNKRVKKEAEDFKSMLMAILNEVPQKIFLKDAEGKMYIANQKVADAHGLPLSELIGKSDYDFVDKETADDWRKQELEIMEKGEDIYVFEDNLGGKKSILESIKKVFNIQPLNQMGLLGIQNDITEKVELEARVKELEGK